MKFQYTKEQPIFIAYRTYLTVLMSEDAKMYQIPFLQEEILCACICTNKCVHSQIFSFSPITKIQMINCPLHDIGFTQIKKYIYSHAYKTFYT